MFLEDDPFDAFVSFIPISKKVEVFGAVIMSCYD